MNTKAESSYLFSINNNFFFILPIDEYIIEGAEERQDPCAKEFGSPAVAVEP